MAQLITDAKALGCDAIVFQALPAQMSLAIAWAVVGCDRPIEIGAIVSKPGPRPAGVSMTRAVIDVSCQNAGGGVDAAIDLVWFVNPNAKLDLGKYSGGYQDLTVTVDPPMRFEFSHVEWFF